MNGWSSSGSAHWCASASSAWGKRDGTPSPLTAITRASSLKNDEEQRVQASLISARYCHPVPLMMRGVNLPHIKSFPLWHNKSSFLVPLYSVILFRCNTFIMPLLTRNSGLDVILFRVNTSVITDKTVIRPNKAG
jgi:hypothetical protein